MLKVDGNIYNRLKEEMTQKPSKLVILEKSHSILSEFWFLTWSKQNRFKDAQYRKKLKRRKKRRKNNGRKQEQTS